MSGSLQPYEKGIVPIVNQIRPMSAFEGNGVEFVAELGHSITGPLDKWANKPTTTARAATLPKIATLAP